MTRVQIRRVHSFTGHADAVYTLHPGASASRFFSGAGDGMVVQWDFNKPEEGDLVARLPNSVYALHYLDDAGLLVAGHNYEGIHLLDPAEKRSVGSLQLTTAAIFDIRSLQGRILVATADGMIIIVDTKTLSVLKRVKGSDKSARSIAVNEHTGDIAVGFSDHSIRVYDDGLKLKTEWRGHENSVFTVRFSPDGQLLLSGSRDARLKVWDARAGYKKHEEVVAHLYAINHIEFSPDGKHFVTCSMDKTIKVWDATAFQLLKVIDKARHAGHGSSVNRLLWTRFHHQLLSAGDDRSIAAWQIIF